MTKVIGTKNRDLILGTGFDDVLNGGNSADVYAVGPDSGQDFYVDSGAKGRDQIVALQPEMEIGIASGFKPRNGIEVISANGQTGVDIAGADTADVLVFSATELIGIEKIVGRGGDDRIMGSAADDDIRGNNGDDRLAGGAGNDRLFGGAANDLVTFLNSAHRFDGKDSLAGGAGADELAGGAEDDLLFGGKGDDLLHGGLGFDRLTGGADADTFRFAAISQTGNLVTDFRQGLDLIDLSAIDADRSTSVADEAFRWGGVAEPQAHAVTVSVVGQTTVLSMDVDGDALADMTLRLSGVVSFTADDFLL